MSDLGLMREKNFSSDTWSKLKNLMKSSRDEELLMSIIASDPQVDNP